MNKQEIINKLHTDKKAYELLIASGFASDAQIKRQAKLDYINNLIEWITLEGKV